MPGPGRSCPTRLGSGHLLGHPRLTCPALQPAQHRPSRALGMILQGHWPSPTDVPMYLTPLLCLTSVHAVPPDPGRHQHLWEQESQVQALCPHLLPGDFSWAPSSFLSSKALPS